MRHLLLLSLLLAVVELKRPFCPGDGKPGRPAKCRSNDSQYKCGVFLEELVSDFPITWLGALPDALKKVTPAEYKEILGEDIAPESFENFNCDITAANSRCYATVKRWLRNDADFKANGRDNIRIPIYYSSCGGNWTQVSAGGEGLYVDEPLCCTSVGSFRRCDGSSFKDTC